MTPKMEKTTKLKRTLKIRKTLKMKTIIFLMSEVTDKVITYNRGIVALRYFFFVFSQ